jgi:hypothetical protein
MMKRVMALIAVLAFAAGAAAELRAQVRFGGQLSFGDNADFGIGARLEYTPRRLIPNAPVVSSASFDWFFPDERGVDYWELNYNIAYQFQADALRPYAGGGLNLAHESGAGGSDTRLGLNLLGGLKFRTAGRLAPFVEARVELSGGEQFVITGGVLF